MKLSEHFDSSEFDCHGNGIDCHCGGQGHNMNPILIKLLEQLKKNCGGYPLYITSGYRCPTHNANVGGASQSQHKLWNACDIACPYELDYGEFRWYCENVSISDDDGTRLHFDAIGNYPKGMFVHVDVRDNGRGQQFTFQGA